MNTYTFRVQEQKEHPETGRWLLHGDPLKAAVSARNVDLAVFLALRQARSQGMKHPKVVSGPDKLPSQGPMRQIQPEVVIDGVVCNWNEISLGGVRAPIGLYQPAMSRMSR